MSRLYVFLSKRTPAPSLLCRCHWRDPPPPPLTSRRDTDAQSAAGFIPAARRLRCGPSGPFCCDHSRQWEVNPKRIQAQSPPASSLHPGASHPLLYNGLSSVVCGRHLPRFHFCSELSDYAGILKGREIPSQSATELTCHLFYNNLNYAHKNRLNTGALKHFEIFTDSSLCPLRRRQLTVISDRFD